MGCWQRAVQQLVAGPVLVLEHPHRRVGRGRRLLAPDRVGG